MKKRILFVDDEAAVLAGLRNALWRDQGGWEMVFVLGGEKALEEIRRQHFDAVVTDMRMAGADGVAVLQAAKDKSPKIARIVLTGYAEDMLLAKAMPLLHRLLRKPCDGAELREAIRTSLTVMARS